MRTNSATQVIRRSWTQRASHDRPVVVRRRRFLDDSARGVACRRRRIQPHVVRSRPLNGQTLVRVQRNLLRFVIPRDDLVRRARERDSEERENDKEERFGRDAWVVHFFVWY